LGTVFTDDEYRRELNDLHRASCKKEYKKYTNEELVEIGRKLVETGRKHASVKNAVKQYADEELVRKAKQSIEWKRKYKRKMRKYILRIPLTVFILLTNMH